MTDKSRCLLCFHSDSGLVVDQRVFPLKLLVVSAVLQLLSCCKLHHFVSAIRLLLIFKLSSCLLFSNHFLPKFGLLLIDYVLLPLSFDDFSKSIFYELDHSVFKRLHID